MGASSDYQKIVKQLTDDDLEDIAKYYKNWTPEPIIDLKFRFIKLVTTTRKDRKIRWYHLNQLVNRRRIEKRDLKEVINSVIDRGIYPLRLFQSCTEWLAPHEVWRNENSRIIKSGFIPLENDRNLSTSLETACELENLVKNPRFVFSGNKSVHVWVPLEISSFDDKELAYANRREEKEITARKNYFRQISRKINHTLDYQIATDPRRVVPMISSLNGFTRKRVIEIEGYNLCQLTGDMIRKRSFVNED